MERGRLGVSIETGNFDCSVCYKPLRPPIFEACHDKSVHETCGCPLCWVTSFGPSGGMGNAVESIRVDCPYAVLGCTQKTTYYGREEHEAACPHARCFCPASDCGFAGHPEDLWEHLVNHPLLVAPVTSSFSYFKPFHLEVDLNLQYSWRVLRSEDDGQLFILNVEPAEPHGGHAVALACVRAGAKESKYGCSLSFSCFKGQHGSASLCCVPRSTLFGGPPTDFFCVMPRTSDLGHAVALTVTIDTEVDLFDDGVEEHAEEEEDNDGSYHGDEDDDE